MRSSPGMGRGFFCGRRGEEGTVGMPERGREGRGRESLPALTLFKWGAPNFNKILCIFAVDSNGWTLFLQDKELIHNMFHKFKTD